jgi:predicted transposase/invertase (TIGR01784 family)
MSNDTPHDSLFRYTFTQPAVAADHFRAHLPPAVAALVRWETLQHQPGSFVDEALSQVHSDVLYRVALQGQGELWLYVLFEHQARPDAWMPWRVLRYMVRIWDRFLEESRDARQQLPFILPMVLYNGDRNWTAPLQFHELFRGPLPEEARRQLLEHVPAFEYQLQDLSEMDDEELQGLALRRLVLLSMKHARKADFWQRLPAWLDTLRAVTEQPADGLRALEAVWRYLQEVTPREPTDEVRALLTQTLPAPAQRLIVTWAEILKNQGREQGLLQGQARALLRQLRAKFGELPEAIVTRVQQADEEQLDQWTERILTAETLEALFR